MAKKKKTKKKKIKIMYPSKKKGYGGIHYPEGTNSIIEYGDKNAKGYKRKHEP